MLSYDETLELVKKAQKGDQNAKSMLIEENSPLVKSVIKRFRNKNIEYEDLYQIGCVGFLKAINNFDSSFNVKFSTYVVPMIIGEVKRFLRDDGIIKVSRAIKTQNALINKFIREYEEENNSLPTIRKIATYFNLDEQEVIFIMDSSKMPISLYTPIEEKEKSLLLIDRLSNDEEGDNMLYKLEIQRIISTLSDREKKLVLLRFYRDKTQTEIAQALNISQVQVSRLENKIIKQIRNLMKCN